MQLIKSKYKGFVPRTNGEFGYYSLRYEPANLILGKLPHDPHIANNIQRLAEVFCGTTKADKGYWEIIIKNDKKQELKYKFLIAKTILEEELFVDNQVVLHRNTPNTTIFSTAAQAFEQMFIPADMLAIQYLQDKRAYSYLHELAQWAQGIQLLQATTDANETISQLPADAANAIIAEVQADLTALNLAAFALQVNSSEPKPTIHIAEPNLQETIPLAQLSGNIRGLIGTLVGVRTALRNAGTSLIVISDIGKYAEAESADLLVKHIFALCKSADKQLIAQTSQPCLLRNVDMQLWSILFADESIVRALHYNNSRFKFREFEKANFDNNTFDQLFKHVV